MPTVFLDVIPALLQWEGRDRVGPPSVSPGAAHALGHLFEGFQVVAVFDAGIASKEIADHLEVNSLRHFFDAVISTAAHGPGLDARVLRRMSGSGRRRRQPIVVTGRRPLADELARSRIPVVYTEPENFEGVVDAVYSLAAGRPEA